jgi:hypothetical protein
LVAKCHVEPTTHGNPGLIRWVNSKTGTPAVPVPFPRSFAVSFNPSLGFLHGGCLSLWRANLCPIFSAVVLKICLATQATPQVKFVSMRDSTLTLLVANRFQVGGAVCGLLLSLLVAISEIPSATLSTRPFQSRYAASLCAHVVSFRMGKTTICVVFLI